MSWPFCTNRPIPPDSPVYAERKADHQLRQHLLAMDCVQLTAPPQMGKTSLIHRLQTSLGSGYTIVHAEAPYQLDIKSQGRQQGFRKLLQALARQVEDAHERVVIALDEPNSIPEGLRETLQWFIIARRTEPRLRDLTFILAEDSAASILPVQGKPLMSPLTLKDFYRPQVRQLVDFLRVRGKLAEAITDRIYRWTGGHPYLTQKMCSLLAGGDLPLVIEGVDRAAERIWREDAVHLPHILGKLGTAPGAKEQLEEIMSGKRIAFNSTSRSALIGVIKSDEYGNCTVRNRIYEEALKRRL